MKKTPSLYMGFQNLSKYGKNENENECGVVFTYASPDGEEGYPGNVLATVQYTLNNNNQLHIGYRAITDKSTPVNFTNHSYFNLTGFEKNNILDHHLQIVADEYTEKSAGNTPTGAMVSVYNTALNFTNPRLIGNGINCFPNDMGYDHNFILSRGAGKKIVKALLLVKLKDSNKKIRKLAGNIKTVS